MDSESMKIPKNKVNHERNKSHNMINLNIKIIDDDII